MKTNNKDIIREFFKSKTRFLAIFIINLLGISTFIGLNVLSKDMHKTIDNLYSMYNVADIKVSSNIALDQRDLDILNNLEYISDIEYGYNEEIYINNSKDIINVKNIPKKISTLKLIDGKFPDKINEIIIESTYKNKYRINDNIKLENDKIFNVVGYYENVEDRLENSKNIAFKGYSVVKINAYTILEYFQNKEYTFANIKLNINEPTYSEEYDKFVFDKKIDIQNKIYENSSSKLSNFLDEKYNEINDGKNKIIDAKNEIDKNANKISDAKNKIFNAEKELNSKINEFEGAFEKFQINENKINKNKTELIEKYYELKENKVKIEEGLKELETNKTKILDGLQEIENGILLINENKINIDKSKEEVLKNKEYVDNLKPNLFVSNTKIEEGKKQISNALMEIEQGEIKLEKEKINLLNKKYELNENLKFILNKIKELEENNSKIDDGLIQVENGIDKLDDGTQLLINEKNKYNLDYQKNLNDINQGKKKIEKNKKEINIAEEKFENERNKANFEINKSLNEIEVNERKLDNLKVLYFVNSRIDNPSYSSFIESVDSLNIISKLFPIIFYLIVILVSTTTMTRMVDEQRNSIGTYLFLGYSKWEISKKYYYYALIPTILGITLGIYFGLFSMPKFIYTAFRAGSISAYNDLQIIIDFKIIIISIISSILSTIISVYLALKNDFNIEISDLLKPKVPKYGTKILLENIKFIWEKLMFSNKITLRNIFRYKGKMIMNILGVSGCTALIFLGFAIRNSFSEISEIQYNKIRNFHAEVNLKQHLNENEIDTISKVLKDNFTTLSLQSIDAKFIVNDRENNIKMYIIDDINISNFIYLTNDITDDGVVISKRTLTLLNKGIGDEIIVTDYIGNNYNLKVKNITENYQGNYIYMSRNYYENSLNKEYKINNIIIKDTNKNLDSVLDYEEVQSISLNKTYKEIFDKISESLNFIVVFITLLSAVLSIVVTYSLLEINVNERQRELATIKVIGFYAKEVSLYIYKEIFILTVVGIIFGLIFGRGLHKIILVSMEKTNTVFVESTGISPYIFAIILTLFFSIISMLLVHRKLKNIDMIEALKME
ncbi:FtsX-like permease family protein [Streptobacillus canis]|uniref:FtsX-like permease family protein n=1 Tax=Streptobacillus canis TaxID=2678686 RepID=UPI0012E189DB|nr:FtsX-like permease family protein [Streptobacillus canis]